jgi:hypothetical protein
MSDPLFARFCYEVQPGEVLFREDESGDVMFRISSTLEMPQKFGGES